MSSIPNTDSNYGHVHPFFHVLSSALSHAHLSSHLLFHMVQDPWGSVVTSLQVLTRARWADQWDMACVTGHVDYGCIVLWIKHHLLNGGSGKNIFLISPDSFRRIATYISYTSKIIHIISDIISFTLEAFYSKSGKTYLKFVLIILPWCSLFVCEHPSLNMMDSSIDTGIRTVIVAYGY